MLLAEAESKLNSIDKNQAPIPGRNKGGRGLWVEEQLGMVQSSQLNDFEAISYTHLTLPTKA